MLKKIKLLPLAAVAAVLMLAALACSAPAAPEPAIDEAALSRIVADAVAQNAPAPQEQVSAEEIQAMVQSAMMDAQGSQVSASEIQSMVESAVAGAATEGATAEEIEAMVKSAVSAATTDSITASDVESAISMAVSEAQANMVTAEDVQSAVMQAQEASDALTAQDVESIVSKALEERAMMEAPPKETIIFGDLNWDSAQLQNRIAQYIIEKGYGYPTTTKFGATLPLFQGLQNGDTDIAMEIWLPNQNEPWAAARAEGRVVSVGRSLGDDWQSAFVIPKYLQEQYPELDSIEDLRDQQYKDLFTTAETGDKARLVSCIIGWACEEVNAAQITAYGLDEHVQIVNPGDGAALNADLYGAYEKQEPWLGYQWGTNAPALELDLVRLEEPPYSDECWFTTKACAYQDATILIAVNPDLLVKAPDVIEILRQWEFSIDTYKGVVRWQSENPGTDAVSTAIWWLNSNPDIWGGWVTPEAKELIQAALDAGEAADGWPVE